MLRNYLNNIFCSHFEYLFEHYSTLFIESVTFSVIETVAVYLQSPRKKAFPENKSNFSIWSLWLSQIVIWLLQLRQPSIEFDSYFLIQLKIHATSILFKLKEYSVDPSILQEQSFLYDYSEISSCPNTAAVAAPAPAPIPEVAVVMVQRPDVVSRQRSKFPLALKQKVILKYHLFQEKYPGRAREVTLKFFLKDGVRLTNLKAFLSQDGKIMFEDSNLEDRSKIRTADSYLLQIEQHIENHQNNRC
ncbi:Hypothetical_protein [Hexamita inflata]|uniref:Hypothetical_protein n=1 Tax=Hexamita inflata TaxID=28002 RepID=A0AA86UI84_9EUKA|nr:Hypothetical protein HINF_LOCUS39872 [Hexamita inflata]